MSFQNHSITAALLAIQMLGAATTPAAAPIDLAKIVIVKADDYRGPTQGWTNFIQASRAVGIKVSIGVIVEGIAGNATTASAMRTQEAMGDVEFWNHGWDHARWTDSSGKIVSEFGGSGLAHMRTHMADAQAGMKAALGKDASTFGTPYNAFNTDTATVINETPALRLMFAHSSLARQVLNAHVVGIISEQGGTGAPDSTQFKASYPNGPVGPVSLQLHPNNSQFNAGRIHEYQEIIRHLLAKGHTILLPSEYLAFLDAPPSVDTPPAAIPGMGATHVNQAVDIDLSEIGRDAETPAADLLFQVSGGTNGGVTLLADGHTARFTPMANYSGPAAFDYSVTDTKPDPRTFLNYHFQTSSAADASGNGRHGSFTIVGTGGAAAYPADLPTALSPHHNKSLFLTKNADAGAARMERAIPSGELDFLGANWTIAGWFKRSSTTRIDSLLQIGRSGGWGPDALSLVLPIDSSSIALRNYAGAISNVNITQTGIATGVWHHFSVVRNGNALSLFMNGALVDTDREFSFTFDPAEPLKIGGVNAASSTTTWDGWLHGGLADFAVFNDALSAVEISKLHTAPTANFGGQSATNTVTLDIKPDSIVNWKQHHFLTTSNMGDAANTADPDGDGVTNEQEYVFGGNPTTPDTQPLLTISGANGHITLSFIAREAAGTGYAGFTRRFTLESSDDLADIRSWAAVPGYLNIPGESQSVAIGLPANDARKFYRLKVWLE